MRSQSMSRVFYAWYDYFAELKRQREVSERMLRRMLNQKLHSMYNSWRLSAIEIKRQRTAIQRVAARIRLHSEAKCFHCWLDSVHTRQRVREHVKRTTRKWINQNLTVGWRAWTLFVHNSRAAEVKRMQRSAEEKRRDVIIRRAAMRMRSQSMSRVFYAWYDYFAELKRQREVSERMLRRMLNQKLHSMFNSWRLN